MLFLYRYVLEKELQGPIDAIRAKKPKRLPTVLTKQETFKVIGYLAGTQQLMAKLLYGSGLRLLECIRLRVKDVDFAQYQIVVRDAKGHKDRVTMLPEAVVALLQEHLRHVKTIHDDDLAQGYGSVYLPYALERKYPNANREWMRMGSTRRSTSFPLPSVQKTHARAPSAVTTYTRAAYKRRSRKRPSRPASTSVSLATPSATALPPTCSKTATISEPFRNSSATRLVLSQSKERQDHHDLHPRLY